MAEHQEDAPGGFPPEVSLATIASQLDSLKRSLAQSGTNPQVSERGKKARLQPGETLTGNGPLRGYNRTLTVVEELEAIERMLPAEGEPLSSEKAHDVHEAIKKVLASLYKQLEFWKVADMKNFDVAEAWLKEQLGGHDSEWQKQLEAAEKWVERSKPKQQTKEKSAKFAGNKSGGGARQWQQPMQYPPYAYNTGYPAYPQANNASYGQQYGAPYGSQMPFVPPPAPPSAPFGHPAGGLVQQDNRKAKSACRACGLYGHWSGDAVCPLKKQS